jgi:Eukaryotic cytochrome b561
MLDWWLSSLSGAAQHQLPEPIIWHARLMVLAWAVLVPVGVLLARFWKLWPGQAWPTVLDHKAWWHGHRVLQSLAFVLMLGGLAIIWNGQFFGRTSAEHLAGVHRILGWGLVVAAGAQILGGLLRGSKGGPTDTQLRGDHYDMTPRRIAFEWMHKCLGWGALLLSIIAILLGLLIADAPRWMLAALCLWWLVLAALAWRWQLQGRCVDTYQTIWGAAPDLPGLSSLPIGPGIRRIGPLTTSSKSTHSNAHSLHQQERQHGTS